MKFSNFLLRQFIIGKVEFLKIQLAL